ncbi:MAG: biopolymer transporter ExbD [Alphaproteobacteria bacterium]|nr:biopolymer transporter ExbD [Alphaproteobacteria bacterium]
MARPTRHRRPQNLVATINITPFVDVLLVLLALTIVFASDVPGAKSTDTDQVAGALGAEFEKSEIFTLELAEDGTIVLAGQAIDRPELGTALAQLRTDAPAGVVINITAHKNVNYTTLFSVLQAVNSSQVAGVTFAIVQ